MIFGIHQGNFTKHLVALHKKRFGHRANSDPLMKTYTANAYRQTTDKLMFKSVISTVR